MTRDEIAKLLPSGYFVEDSPVFAAFVEVMADHQPGYTIFLTAWHWFKEGWSARQKRGD